MKLMRTTCAAVRSVAEVAVFGRCGVVLQPNLDLPQCVAVGNLRRGRIRDGLGRRSAGDANYDEAKAHYSLGRPSSPLCVCSH